MNWTPDMGTSFKQGRSDSLPMIYELVHFIPAENKFDTVPYTKGKEDAKWVWYPQGQRPTLQKDWERIVGIKLETML
jgi:hypothetical protein